MLHSLFYLDRIRNVTVQRVTRSTALLLSFLLQERRAGNGATWGFEISRATGLKGGTVYPLLNRLLCEGWVEAYWDDESTPGPRRRMYRLTSQGASAATRLLAERRGVHGGEVAWSLMS